MKILLIKNLGGNMKNKKFIYVISKKDDLELPEFYADTLKELSVMSGYGFDCLLKACKRGSLVDKLYQVKKVPLDERFDDKDSFEDYDIFCKRLFIKQSNPTSLDLFMAYCCGV